MFRLVLARAAAHTVFNLYYVFVDVIELLAVISLRTP